MFFNIRIELFQQLTGVFHCINREVKVKIDFLDSATNPTRRFFADGNIFDYEAKERFLLFWFHLG